MAVLACVFAATSSFAVVGQAMATKMDADKDSKVSKAEYVAYFTSSFAFKDKNKDGKLSLAEFPKASTIKGNDADKDGQLSVTEYANIFVRQFDNAHDKNKDGFLTGAEIK